MGHHKNYRNKLICLAVILVAACSTLQRRPNAVESSASANTSLDSLVQKVASKFTGENIDPYDPTFQRAGQYTERQTTALLSKLNSDGSFQGLNYDELPETEWSLSNHYSNLKTLAVAYHLQGQKFHHDSSLLESIATGLAYGNRYFKEGKCSYSLINPPRQLPECGNWYQWILGVPNDLAVTLFLMKDQIPTDIYQLSLNAVLDHIGKRPLSYTDGEPIMTGANLQDLVLVHFFASLMLGDESNLSVLAQAEGSMCKKQNGDGIRRDDSFSQHGKIINGSYSGQVYNDAYGSEFQKRFAQFVNFTSDTQYAIDSGAFEVCSEFIYKGIDWSIYKGQWDISLIGRGVARASNLKADYSSTIVLSKMPGPYRTDFQRAAISVVRSDSAYLLPIEFMEDVVRLKNSAITAGEPSGLRLYPDSDFVIFRHPGFYSSLKMISTRTISGENTLQQNKMGSRLSDGLFYLTQTGEDYVPPSTVSPTLDWTQLPGTTVELNSNTASSVFGQGLQSFVGATGDGRNGVAAMDFQPVSSDPKNPASSTLRAKKSYFFFDDVIVFLGAGISSKSGDLVQTTIDQRRMPDGVSSFWVDGVQHSAGDTIDESNPDSKWAWVNGIGYMFLDGKALHLKAGPQSGRLSDISVGDSTLRTNYFVNLIREHGHDPKSESFAYAIFPSEQNLETFKARLKKPGFRVIQNDPTAAIVENASNDSIGAVLWKPGRFQDFVSDSPAVFYLTQTTASEPHKIFLVADPTQKLGSMNIRVPASYELIADAKNQVTVKSMDSGYCWLHVNLHAGFTTKLEFVVRAH